MCSCRAVHCSVPAPRKSHWTMMMMMYCIILVHHLHASSRVSVCRTWMTAIEAQMLSRYPGMTQVFIKYNVSRSVHQWKGFLAPVLLFSQNIETFRSIWTDLSGNILGSLALWLIDRDCHLPTSIIHLAVVDVFFAVWHESNLNCNQLLYILW